VRLDLRESNIPINVKMVRHLSMNLP